MSENTGENNAAVVVEQEQEPKTSTMADTEETQPQRTVAEKTNNLSFSIWPPSQRTRDAVIKRLVETLSSQSVLSKRYGIIPSNESDDVARRIEAEAFTAADASASADDDGIEILQVYSKDISKRMLEAVKSRSASGSEKDGQNPSDSPAVTVTDEEISTGQSES
ncbi:MFP1 attachment factor 1-like [Diospyros lotus]|uniref:MFP1 attachment factor 1-like n=1 Tax=Diospyros lotus TaxID=55363 RepID=UPI002258E199|nr:MFP1 attachment factor 1-like [Diospyros lotus]